MMSHIEAARQALVSSLLAAGPDSETVCEGWQTRHLAAHLYLREHHPFKVAGTAIPKFAEATERTIQEVGDAHSEPVAYAQLIADFTARPPVWNPLRYGGEPMNLLEYVVHNEDIRRGPGANFPPTILPDAGQTLLRYVLPMAKLKYRKSGDGVVFERADGKRAVVRKGASPVLLCGDAIDLALFISGRERVANVVVQGSDDALERFYARFPTHRVSGLN